MKKKERPPILFIIARRGEKVNGKKAQNNHHLNEGDIISFYYDKKCFKKDLQSDYTINTKIDILFENRDILIINKNAGTVQKKKALWKWRRLIYARMKQVLLQGWTGIPAA